MYPQFVEINNHTRQLNLLSKIAASQTAMAGSRISASIVIKNQVVAFGGNSNRSHPFQARFASNESAIFLHAETSCIYNALKVVSVEDLEYSTLYIARIKFTGPRKRSMEWGLSKPCVGCQRAILTYNIRNVVYTLDSDGYEVV